MSLTTVQPGMLGTPQPYSFKNRIINGAMVLDQRNSGAAITGINAGQYFPVDRFRTAATNSWGSAVFTAQQNKGSVTPPAGFTNYVGFATTTADASPSAGTTYDFVQWIEGYNMADLNWGSATAKTVTLSFWVYSNLTGTFGGTLSNYNQNRCYPFSYTISSANTWTQCFVTISGDITGTWAITNSGGIRVGFSLGCGSTYTGTAGSWGSTLYGGVTGQQQICASTSNYLYLTGVQLEVGVSATTFDYRAYGQELALCQRYLPVIPFAPLGQYLLYSGMAYSSIYSFFAIPFLVSARVAPTGISYSGTVSNLTIYNAATTIAPIAMIIDSASTSRITIRTQVASGQTTGYCVFLASETGAATQILCTGCEL